MGSQIFHFSQRRKGGGPTRIFGGRSFLPSLIESIGFYLVFCDRGKKTVDTTPLLVPKLVPPSSQGLSHNYLIAVLRIRIRSFWVTRTWILYPQKDPCNFLFLVI